MPLQWRLGTSKVPNEVAKIAPIIRKPTLKCKSTTGVLQTPYGVVLLRWLVHSLQPIEVLVQPVRLLLRAREPA
jgi:hypothetical protein